MDALKVNEYARQMLAALGDRAEAEAAQKAARLTAEGQGDEAASWTRIRSAIRELRGTHVS